jgi:hypothetical protein
MAFWTAPFSRGESHAADACLAALAQQRAIGELQQRLPDILGLRRELPEFRVRMGLATGDLVVGTIGAPTARSFTVIGDTVNLASRLEGRITHMRRVFWSRKKRFSSPKTTSRDGRLISSPCSAKWNRCACTRSWRRPEAFPMRSKNCAACSPRGWRPIAPVTGIAQSSALPMSVGDASGWARCYFPPSLRVPPRQNAPGGLGWRVAADGQIEVGGCHRPVPTDLGLWSPPGRAVAGFRRSKPCRAHEVVPNSSVHPGTDGSSSSSSANESVSVSLTVRTPSGEQKMAYVNRGSPPGSLLPGTGRRRRSPTTISRSRSGRDCARRSATTGPCRGATTSLPLIFVEVRHACCSMIDRELPMTPVERKASGSNSPRQQAKDLGVPVHPAQGS